MKVSVSPPCSSCLVGKGADDVVGLEAVQYEDGDLEGLRRIVLSFGEGGGEVLGHGVPLRFVIRIEGVPGSGGGGVEGDRDDGWASRSP